MPFDNCVVTSLSVLLWKWYFSHSWLPNLARMRPAYAVVCMQVPGPIALKMKNTLTFLPLMNLWQLDIKTWEYNQSSISFLIQYNNSIGNNNCKVNELYSLLLKFENLRKSEYNSLTISFLFIKKWVWPKKMSDTITDQPTTWQGWDIGQ